MVPWTFHLQVMELGVQTGMFNVLCCGAVAFSIWVLFKKMFSAGSLGRPFTFITMIATSGSGGKSSPANGNILYGDESWRCWFLFFFFSVFRSVEQICWIWDRTREVVCQLINVAWVRSFVYRVLWRNLSVFVQSLYRKCSGPPVYRVSAAMPGKYLKLKGKWWGEKPPKKNSTNSSNDFSNYFF